MLLNLESGGGPIEGAFSRTLGEGIGEMTVPEDTLDCSELKNEALL